MVNIKSGKIEGFKQYSQFESLKEFNHHMEMWMLEHKTNFSKGELVGFKRLVRFAAKFPGVCNAKIGTMLKAIHDEYNENGISRSTFKRMISKAKDLGIFTVYETERQSGWQSSNLYVFNRFPESEPPRQLNHPKETSNLLETKKDQKINKRKGEPSELDHTFVSSIVPQRFVQFVKCFFSDAKLIEEYWHMTHVQVYDLNMEIDEVVDLAIESFRQLIRKLKFTKAVRKPIAYYYGILQEKLYHFLMERANEMHEDSPIEDEPHRYILDGEIIEWDWMNGKSPRTVHSLQSGEIRGQFVWRGCLPPLVG